MKRNVTFEKWVLLLLAASAASLSLADDALRGAGPREPTTPAAPARATVLTLETAIDTALADSPELRASSSRIEAAQGRAAQARLWPNPELTVAAEDIPARSGSFSDSKSTLGVAQRVPYPGKKKLDGQVGAAGTRVAEAEWALRRLELVRDVKAAFFRVLAAERLVAVSRELAAVAESSATTARKRVEAGAAADQEQLRAEIQLDQAGTELAGFERETSTARQELATLLGHPEWSEARVSGTLVDRPDHALLEIGSEQWLAQHPGHVAARNARDQTLLELKRARLEPYPDVTLGVSGGREGPADVSIVEFRLGLPLPIFDRSKGRKQEARANVGVAQAQVAAAEQRLLRDWRIARQRFRAAAQQVASYRDRILPKANDALRLVQTGFQEGKFGFMDLLDTQRTTAEARLLYQQRLLDLNVAQAELQAFVAPLPAHPTN